MQLNLGDFVGFDIVPDGVPRGVEGRIVMTTSGGWYVVYVPGYGRLIFSGDDRLYDYDTEEFRLDGNS